MKYVEFMTKMANDDLAGIYLFDSKEEYLNMTVIEQAYEKVSIKDFNLIRLKGEIAYEELKNSYETYPVMEDKKYIIWQNIDLSKNNIKDYSNILDALGADIENFPSFAILFIFSDKQPFKGKFYKEVKKYGNIVEIERLNISELRSFIGKRFLKNNKKITKKDIDNIINRFAYVSKDSDIDLYEVVNSVDKIISNSEEEIIQSEDINQQLDQVLNLNIFNLTDAIFSKDGKKAIDIFMAMANEGEDLFMIFHMIIRQVRILIVDKTLREKSYNDTYIQKIAGIGTFELKKADKFIRNFSLDKLLEIHDRIYSMEVRQKSEEFAMKNELIKLIAFICKI